jgi:hypothetical protein
MTATTQRDNRQSLAGSTYSFTLILDRDPELLMDELYEAGCDDALFGVIDEAGYADFDREAPSMEEAIVSAIQAIDGVGLNVVRIEPDDLVTASEIAERLGRSRESIRLLIERKRGKGDFPSPYTHMRDRNRLWRWSDVADWAGLADEVPAAQFIAAANAALELDLELSRSRMDLGDLAEKLGTRSLQSATRASAKKAPRPKSIA